VTRDRRGQRGQTLLIFALVAAFVLLGVIALVGDSQVLFVNSNRADGDALLAAQAGASAIDTAALYGNVLRLDPVASVLRCQQAVQPDPRIISVTCGVSGNTVTATVVERVDMPVPLLGATQTLSATRTAKPAYGGVTGGF
jgi:urea transporter